MQTRYAGFWIRFVADLIDSVILTIASWALEYLVLGIFHGIHAAFLQRSGQSVPSFGEEFNAFFLQMFNMGAYFCLAFPYYVWGHFRYGTTLGKRPLGVYVVNHGDLAPITLNQSLIRFFGYGVSYLVFLCGFLMAAFHPEKRALHDLLAGTVSIRKGAKT